MVGEDCAESRTGREVAEEARRLLPVVKRLTNTCCCSNTFVAMSHGRLNFEHPSHLFEAVTRHIGRTVGRNTTVSPPVFTQIVSKFANAFYYTFYTN